MKIGIIGTAGRREDGSKMCKSLYHSMYHDVRLRVGIAHANQTVQPPYSSTSFNTYDGVPLDLVSGGAAWADHLAVSLFLGDYLVNSLHLYFPCKWEFNTNYKNHTFDNSDVGKTANYYHQQFGLAMNGKAWSTRQGIQRAIEKGATYSEITEGFRARNLLVGKVDLLIAYTWGEGEVPKDGGTKHCWDHSKALQKIHVPLSSLEF